MDVLTGGRFGGFPPLGFDRAPVAVAEPVKVAEEAAVAVAAAVAAAEALSPVPISWRRLREKLPAAGSLAARSCRPKTASEKKTKKFKRSRNQKRSTCKSSKSTVEAKSNQAAPL